MARMKIAMIASEATPFAKTGGLADVIGTLSTALGRLGYDVCVIAPAYRSTVRGDFDLQQEIKYFGGLFLEKTHPDATVLVGSLSNGVSVFLVRLDRYFDRESLYGTAAGDYPDNAERYSFFCRAALEILRRRSVDIVHCHDWQAALTAVFLRAQPEQ